MFSCIEFVDFPALHCEVRTTCKLVFRRTLVIRGRSLFIGGGLVFQHKVLTKISSMCFRTSLGASTDFVNTQDFGYNFSVILTWADRGVPVETQDLNEFSTEKEARGGQFWICRCPLLHSRAYLGFPVFLNPPLLVSR